MLKWLFGAKEKKAVEKDFKPFRPPKSRLFGAASFNRLNEDWKPFLESPDQVIYKEQRTLVARSREQAANNDYVKAYLRISKNNVVGYRGIRLESRVKNLNGELDSAANEAIESAFNNWGKKGNCDITGKFSWRGLQKLAIITVLRDGEAFFKKIYGKLGGEYGFVLQGLDPQRCPPDFHNSDIGNGRFIRSGIEYDAYGKPLAYYFTSSNHDTTIFNYSYGGRDFERVEAKHIYHLFDPEMVAQKRGFPSTATGLTRLKNLNAFEEASVVNARVGAAKMGFIEWKENYGYEMEGEDCENLMIDTEAGQFGVLPSGASLKEWNPAYPTSEFAPFRKSMLQGVAAGLGVSYNNLASDLENVNYSSIRQGTLEERDNWKEIQEWLIEDFIEPVFKDFLKVALLGDKVLPENSYKPLPAGKYDQYLKGATFQGRRWDWINPQDDINADVTAKNNLLKPAGTIIRENGGDPDDVWRNIAADIKAMETAGIDKDYIMAAMFGNNVQSFVQKEMENVNKGNPKNGK